MEGKELIAYIKANYKPKEGYSMLLAIGSESGRYIYSVHKVTEIKSKKYGKVDYAEESISCGSTSDSKVLKEKIGEYIIKISNNAVTTEH